MGKRKKKADESEQIVELQGQPELWPTLDEATFVKLVIRECLAFTTKAPQAMLDRMSHLYDLFVERSSATQREQVEKAIVQSILGAAHARALLPFMLCEPDLSLISTAALDFSVLREPTEEDGLFTGPKFLLSNLNPEVGLSETSRTGILMGLVLLGDRRLLPLLDGTWRLLSPEGRDSLTRATSGYITAGLIDFFLMWLEQTDDESNFGGIVGTLCRMPSVSTNGMVLDIERAFPIGSPDDPEGSGRVLRTWTFPEYYKKIQRRLKKIERRESEPKLIPEIATYWNEAPDPGTLFDLLGNLLNDSGNDASEGRESDDIEDEAEEIQIVTRGVQVFLKECDGRMNAARAWWVYRWKNRFVAGAEIVPETDNLNQGPFDTFDEAIDANDLLRVSEATTNIECSLLSAKAIASRLECFAEDGHAVRINGQDWVYQAKRGEFKRVRKKK